MLVMIAFSAPVGQVHPTRVVALCAADDRGLW